MDDAPLQRVSTFMQYSRSAGSIKDDYAYSSRIPMLLLMALRYLSLLNMIRNKVTRRSFYHIAPDQTLAKGA